MMSLYPTSLSSGTLENQHQDHDQEEEQDETKRTGIVDNSSERS